MADCCSSLVGSSPSVSVLMYEAARDTPHRMISRVRYDPANAVGKDASLRHLGKEGLLSLGLGLPNPRRLAPLANFFELARRSHDPKQPYWKISREIIGHRSGSR